MKDPLFMNYIVLNILYCFMVAGLSKFSLSLLEVYVYSKGEATLLFSFLSPYSMGIIT